MRTEIVREKAMITNHKGDNIRGNEGTPHPEISRNGTTKTHRTARIACDTVTWKAGRLVNF